MSHSTECTISKRILRRRNFANYVLPSVVGTSFLISGCAKPTNRSPDENVKNVGILCAIVAFVILFICALFRVTRSFALIGVCVGLILGSCIILSVPIEVQYAFLGGMLGISGDFLASSSSSRKPRTMIESLSSFIINATKAASKAASEAEIEHDKRRVSILIWSAAGTVALMLVIGRSLDGLA